MVLLAVHEKCTKPQAYNVRKGLTATKPTAVTAAPFTYSGQLLCCFLCKKNQKNEWKPVKFLSIMILSSCLKLSFFLNPKELRNTIVDPVELDQAIESLHSKYSKKTVNITCILCIHKWWLFRQSYNNCECDCFLYRPITIKYSM